MFVFKFKLIDDAAAPLFIWQNTYSGGFIFIIRLHLRLYTFGKSTFNVSYATF